MLLTLLLGCPVPTAGTDHVPGDTGKEHTGDTADTADSDSGDTGGDTLEFAEGDLHLGIPSYVSPDNPAWAQWVDGAAQTGGFVIINPSSGPGGHADDAYTAAVPAAQALGVKVLGYVATGYGLKDAGEVDTEITKYNTWYAVDGIFFDEVAEDCPTYAPWYAERAAAADGQSRSGNAFIVYNPGLITCADYLDAADVLVVAEDSLSNLRTFAPAAWMADYNPSRFWFLAYEVGAAILGDTLQIPRDSGVGWVYVTDGHLPNPWDHAPNYWDEEVGAAEADGY